MFEQGSVLTFSYPSVNRVGAKTRLETRRLVIEGERDLRQKPLSVISIVRRPTLRRGPLLLWGFDLDRQRPRKFYFDSIRSLRISDQPLMRLGIYDALGLTEPVYFDKPLTDSRADMEHARRVIEHMNQLFIDRGTGQIVRLFPLIKKARAA